ncbi:cell wall-binding protein [Clostridium sp.]|uniref:cell wall-binding protein n=1 Tax=Clostridium sp. TaxID=1506 RepID=UPI00284015B7|nr:cell wall-binding protein [Clostridium sp.]MDR3597885.1 cell wall-binding protein [Clostridium sp.]
MKKLKLTKLIVSLLVVASVLSLNQIGASAQWRQDSNGWWNSEGNSWSEGWECIDGEWYYFDNNGYMKTGWLNDGGKWYYLYNSGAMAKDVVIDGYPVGYDGAWIQRPIRNSSNQSNSIQNDISKLSNVNSNGTTISDVTGIKLDDITKIDFFDGRGGLNDTVTIEDKEKVKEVIGYLKEYKIRKAKDSELKAGWAHGALFYINNKVVMDVTFGDPISLNRDNYKVTKGDFDDDKIDNFLKAIYPSYRTSWDSVEASEN